MNFPLIAHLVGSVLVIISAFMLSGVGVSALYMDGDLMAMSISTLITLFVGMSMFLGTVRHRRESFKHRDVFGVVTLTWLAISLFGAVPFMVYEMFFSTRAVMFASFTDAYFEAMAGFTTTGATIISDIESLPHGILFWRSLTQWIGGMGIILFALAVLPYISGGGAQLFRAEVPEITVDRLKPRIIDTAKVLWIIYTALTLAATALYFMGGMSLFDSICHAFTTMATGGFSTKNASIAHFRSAYIDYVSAVFMILAGVNYTLYFSLMRGEFKRFHANNELRFYLTIVLASTVMIAIYELPSYGNIYDALRYAFFQAASIMTTTGYATADYEQWTQFSQILLVFLMFFGGMIGSTGGGMKQVRMLLMLKQGYRELYQLIHPRAFMVVKLDGSPVPKEILGSIWGFLFLFLFVCVLGTLAMTAMGVDMITASTTVVSAASNVGPALGDAGPVENYFSLPAGCKWVLIFCMLAGRLEMFTVLVFLVPGFWKK